MHLVQDENGNPVPHGHDHAAPTDEKQMKALVEYNLHHNEHHAEELHDLAHKLKDAGKMEAAEELHYAVDAFDKVNEHLKKALEIL